MIEIAQQDWQEKQWERRSNKGGVSDLVSLTANMRWAPDGDISGCPKVLLGTAESPTHRIIGAEVKK